MRIERALIAATALTGVLVGAGGYLLGHSSGEDLDRARDEGRAVGVARGIEDGFESGFKEGRQDGYRKAHQRAYIDAYNRELTAAGYDAEEPKEIEVPEP